MDASEPLVILVGNLVVLSFLAIGGINVVVPELHRVTVITQGWLTDAEFAMLFALAQAAPGPNMLFITLIGWKLAGIAGGIAATLALCAPPFAIAYGVARLWLVWGEQWWFRLVRRALAPLTVGLMAASALLLTNAAAVGLQSYLLTGISAAVLLATRLHPVVVLAAAGAVGFAGFV